MYIVVADQPFKAFLTNLIIIWALGTLSEELVHSTIYNHLRQLSVNLFSAEFLATTVQRVTHQWAAKKNMHKTPPLHLQSSEPIASESAGIDTKRRFHYKIQTKIGCPIRDLH